MPNVSRSSSGLPSMPLYNVTIHYDAVKNRWFGLGDYTTQNPAF